MTFEDEARNDLQRAWEYSADNLRQRVTGTSPTTEETQVVGVAGIEPAMLTRRIYSPDDAPASSPPES